MLEVLVEIVENGSTIDNGFKQQDWQKVADARRGTALHEHYIRLECSRYQQSVLPSLTYNESKLPIPMCYIVSDMWYISGGTGSLWLRE